MPAQVTDTLWNWASDIDEGTLLQAGKASRLPIISGHIALMPDAHVGMGATVGSVIPTENAVIPVGGRRGHRMRNDCSRNQPDRLAAAGRP